MELLFFLNNIFKFERKEFILVTVSIEIPDALVQYAISSSPKSVLTRNAMILYPYIHSGVISHGKAAEILGIFKMDLITLYGELGIPYIKMSDTEIEEKLEVVNHFKEILNIV